MAVARTSRTSLTGYQSDDARTRRYDAPSARAVSRYDAPTSGARRNLDLPGARKTEYRAPSSRTVAAHTANTVNSVNTDNTANTATTACDTSRRLDILA